MNEIDIASADLNLLVLFEVVFAERHVGRAASRLHLTPSAVSHGLGRLRALLHDPLFLRTPKGVTPTARALELVEPIADVLARTRRVLAISVPFEPASSRRRFVLGAPDGVASVFAEPLLARVRAEAPGIDLGIRQLLPIAGEPSPDRAWLGVYAELESRALDLAIVPIDDVPARFEGRLLHEEDFVLAMRKDHRLARRTTLAHYVAASHLVVSAEGDAFGFVDRALATRGLARRVALTVPNFMFALAALAESDLVAALPRGFASRYADRFGLVIREPPIELGRFPIRLVVPRAALLDTGVAWLVELLSAVAAGAPPRRRARTRARITPGTSRTRADPRSSRP